MCGICGIASVDAGGPPDVEGRIRAAIGAMEHRGPDDTGIFVSPGIALGSARLAVQDISSRGHMPMSTPDGRFTLVYNGEVYNFRELQPLAETFGGPLRSGTDTEVVLRLYAKEGPRMLDRLNGMFAFAVWDALDRSLFLARDRVGVKPLYYSDFGGMLAFASEPKALGAAGLALEFDHDSWHELLCFRFVAGERTPIRGVRRLLPGHTLTWKAGVSRVRSWWSLAERAEACRADLPADPVRWYRETLDDAIRLRLIADVPVGVLLSGGKDSSSIVASMTSQKRAVETFTVGFAEAGYDEAPLARQVAEAADARHHEIRLSGNDCADLLDEASALNDEPLVHANEIHLLAISRVAKPLVTVLLSGEGADETLGGYVRYRALAHPLQLMGASAVPPTLARWLPVGRVRKFMRLAALGTPANAVQFNACDLFPNEIHALLPGPVPPFGFREAICREAAALYPRDLVRQAMYSDQRTFLCSILDRNDRMTMAASIECREPFVDYRLVEKLAALPSQVLFPRGVSKHLLIRAVGERLPGTVLKYRKWGFGVPWNEYFRSVPALRARIADLHRAPVVADGPLDSAIVQATTEAYLAGDDAHQPLVRQLLFIEAWHRSLHATPRVQPLSLGTAP